MKTRNFLALLLGLLLVGCTTDSGDDKSAELALGTYQYSETEVWTEAEDGVDATVIFKGQLELKSDQTFLLRGYITSTDLEVTDLLAVEFQGNFQQNGMTINQTNILVREVLDLSTGQMSSLKTPDDGSSDSSQIRNVTATTFQEYDDDENRWITWSKP